MNTLKKAMGNKYLTRVSTEKENKELLRKYTKL